MSEVLVRVIDRLSRVPGVRGALIVDAEAGVPVMMELAEGVNGRAVAALIASLFQRTALASTSAGLGSLATLQLEAENGHIVAAGGTEMLVIAIVERDAQLGMVRLEAYRAAERLT